MQIIWKYLQAYLQASNTFIRCTYNIRINTRFDKKKQEKDPAYIMWGYDKLYSTMTVSKTTLHSIWASSAVSKQITSISLIVICDLVRLYAVRLMPNWQK